VPDLGADLVRVFSIGVDGIELTEVEPLVAAPGSGPRHVDFLEAPDGTIYMYLITELANTITGYRVSYPTDTVMQFDRFFQIPSHGAGNQVPEGAAAAEITISVSYTGQWGKFGGPLTLP
jgi:6-phosphogluconolactonase (cycloisomerase 2 family)